MHALLFADGQLSYHTEHPQPRLRSGEALLRLLLAGICSTDLEIVRGYVGFQGVLGHEFVGRVEAVADEENADWIGRRVVGSINLGCGRCPECAANGPEHCPKRTVLGIHSRDGAFGDFDGKIFQVVLVGFRNFNPGRVFFAGKKGWFSLIGGSCFIFFLYFGF